MQPQHVRLLGALLVAAVDARRHKYGHNRAHTETVTANEPPPQPVPETFLRELVANFKSNEDAESLVLPSTLSRSERRLVHIYAAQQGLGHKSIHGERHRSLVLRKDDAWVARRKRRYIEAESSEAPELLPDSHPRQYSWLVGVAAYYALLH